MDLARMQAFVAVAEAGGFSRAACPRSGSQPTLSRQVKALEEELGRKLFDRMGRRVELTGYGRECLERVREILARTEALAASGRHPSGAVTGVLRIGVADSVVLRHFPRLLQRFRRQHPGVRAHVRTGLSPEILAWVRDGRCDVGLCMLPQRHPDLALRELWRDWFVALAPPDHPLADRRADLAEFAAEKQISIEPSTLSFQVLVAAFQDAGLTLVPDMTFDSFQVILDMISVGMGVGIVSQHVADPALKRKRVARVRLREIDALPRSIGLVLHAERAVEGPLAAFEESIAPRPEGALPPARG